MTFFSHYSCVIIIHMIAVSCSSGHFIKICYIKDFASYIVYCEVWMYMIVGIQLVCIVGSECILLWGYSLSVLWGVSVYYCGDKACWCVRPILFCNRSEPTHPLTFFFLLKDAVNERGELELGVGCTRQNIDLSEHNFKSSILRYNPRRKHYFF